MSTTAEPSALTVILFSYQGASALWAHLLAYVEQNSVISPEFSFPSTTTPPSHHRLLRSNRTSLPQFTTATSAVVGENDVSPTLRHIKNCPSPSPLTGRHIIRSPLLDGKPTPYLTFHLLTGTSKYVRRSEGYWFLFSCVLIWSQFAVWLVARLTFYYLWA